MVSRPPRLLGALLAAASGLVVAAVAVLPAPMVRAKAVANMLSPANGATSVPTDIQLVIKFDEVMKANSGKIKVFQVKIPVTKDTTAAQLKAASTEVESIDVGTGSLWSLDSSG
ncbi:MAG: hypothetical protein EBU70_05465, partial [Actinobacteria bacterium]|nr:hypothetical protein [Actinomycetota bacterium]